jgi:hypothetical protein
MVINPSTGARGLTELTTWRRILIGEAADTGPFARLDGSLPRPDFGYVREEYLGIMRPRRCPGGCGLTADFCR